MRNARPAHNGQRKSKAAKLADTVEEIAEDAAELSIDAAALAARLKKRAGLP